jgi:hypothetical protein
MHYISWHLTKLFRKNMQILHMMMQFKNSIALGY